MPQAINWGKVLYNEEEQKLVFFDQRIVRLPEAVINLFHDRVKILDLTNNKISDLDALQYFPNMEELILDNNHITEDVIFPPNSPNLRVLSLNNNRIKNIDLLLKKLIRAFPHLEYLSLLGNTACPYFFLNFDFESYYDYRLHVIANLNRLKFLDTTKVTKIERQMARPTIPHESQSEPSSLCWNDSNASESSAQLTTSPSNTSFGFSRFFPVHWLRRDPKVYNPLPDTEQRGPRAAYGRLSYVYTGKESEGNRFILNNEL